LVQRKKGNGAGVGEGIESIIKECGRAFKILKARNAPLQKTPHKFSAGGGQCQKKGGLITKNECLWERREIAIPGRS